MLQNETTNALLNTLLIHNLLSKNGFDSEDYETLKKKIVSECLSTLTIQTNLS